jgi:hypothetical protein
MNTARRLKDSFAPLAAFAHAQLRLRVASTTGTVLVVAEKR